ncbi:peptide/nickel transport system ATP-binding protein [Mesorhizobium sp. J18]|uniref:dipeptide ABC transporter ATP-binding protein n=1 Tax=Mesorhizobium sp. J18 TaxID=935263 RepID=UPI001198DF04|nr:ABC transporter ATP-binding protein [Mesorhizobium sp. J18]TWG94237.1 peptide/nickel transport system ATP-binding protein [Mesorhizobium sp. J18]
MTLLSIKNLTVSYGSPPYQLKALNAVNIDIAPGETVALVGESGSGKSTIAMAIMDLIPRKAVSGEIFFKGRELTSLPSEERRKLRGRNISIVFQDPFTSLNPSIRIGKQIAEGLTTHLGMSNAQAMKRAAEALKEVGIADPETVANAYPHQLSGGMRQRVLIASALVCNPELLILDEPTTALDVTIEAQVLDLVQEIAARRHVGVLFITHNLGVVNKIADRVCVLYAGQLVEEGTKERVLRDPLHPYTRGLLGSIPKLGHRESRLTPIEGRFPDLTDTPTGCIFEERCPFREAACSEPQQLRSLENRRIKCWKAEPAQVETWPVTERHTSTSDVRSSDEKALVELQKITKRFTSSTGKLTLKTKLGFLPLPAVEKKSVGVLNEISLSIGRGEVLGLVGESGSGKSTLGRIMLKLIDASDGRVVFDGKEISDASDGELKEFRKRAQIVFQNPTSSLNPRRTIGDAISRAFKLANPQADRKTVRKSAEELIDRVGLPIRYFDRYPHQLSGGEKQRVGIARALASNPDLIVCDEPVSALDVSVQATVLNLFKDLRSDMNLSYLFISHDLAVISHISDRIAVLYMGTIVEEGPAAAVLDAPHHPYTEALLSAAAVPDEAETDKKRIVVKGDNIRRVTHGCVFQGRCRRQIGSICETTKPPIRETDQGLRIACHLSVDDLLMGQKQLAENS